MFVLMMQIYENRNAFGIYLSVTHSPCIIFDVFVVKAGINLSQY